MHFNYFFQGNSDYDETMQKKCNQTGIQIKLKNELKTKFETIEIKHLFSMI